MPTAIVELPKTVGLAEPDIQPLNISSMGLLRHMRLRYALIENRVKAVSVCSRGLTSRK